MNALHKLAKVCRERKNDTALVYLDDDGRQSLSFVQLWAVAGRIKKRIEDADSSTGAVGVAIDEGPLLPLAYIAAWIRAAIAAARSVAAFLQSTTDHFLDSGEDLVLKLPMTEAWISLPTCFARLQRCIFHFLTVKKHKEMKGRCQRVIIPLDPFDPPGRLIEVMSDSEVSIVLAKDWGDWKKLESVCSPLPDIKVLDLTFPFSVLEHQMEVNEGVDILEEVLSREDTPNDLAYIWFTSGTTNRPKGCLVPHRCFSHWCDVKNKPHNINSDSVVFIATASTFDPSIGDIFATLCIGGTIAMAPRMIFFANLAYVISKLEVTHITCTPSLWAAQELSPGNELISSLQVLCLGGERPPQHMLDTWVNHLTLLISYGTTECTVFQTVHRVREGEDGSCVGVPLEGNYLKICNEDGSEVVDGEQGEIYQGGVQVCDGYHLDPVASQRFLTDGNGMRWYKTGDYGYLRDGKLYLRGRLDNQVKVRGMRVELGDITHGILKGATSHVLKNCVATVKDNNVIAYCEVNQNGVILDSNDPEEVEAVSDYLIQKASHYLPRHMLPSTFYLMNKLPLSSNGKINLKSLTIKNKEEATEPIYDPSLTKIERFVAEIWVDILDHTGDIGPNSHFLALGGHSLAVLKVSRRLLKLSKDCGVDIDPESRVAQALAPDKLIHTPRLRQYAEILEGLGLARILVLTNKKDEEDNEEIDLEEELKKVKINYSKMTAGEDKEIEKRKEQDHEPWEVIPKLSNEELLYKACYAGVPGICNALFDEGVDIEGGLDTFKPESLIGLPPHLRHRFTPLHIAITSRWDCILDLLIEKKADVHRPDAKLCYAIHKAAERGTPHAMKQLLNKKVNIEQIDKNRLTAMHLAAKAGNEPALKLLLQSIHPDQKPVTINLLDRFNRTACHWAIFSRHVSCVQLLIEHDCVIEGTLAESGGRYFIAEQKQGNIPVKVAKRFEEEYVGILSLARDIRENEGNSSMASQDSIDIFDCLKAKCNAKKMDKPP